METFTRALVVILRDVSIRELLAIECVSNISEDCALLYARIRSERWMDAEWQYMRNHYGELWKRAFLKGAAKRAICAYMEMPGHNGLTILPFLRKKHAYIEGNMGFINHRCFLSDNGNKVEIEHNRKLYDMQDITHITCKFTTSVPIGSPLSFVIITNNNVLKRYLSSNDGSGYVCIPTTDGYSGLLSGAWLTYTKIEIESQDVVFDTRVILAGHKNIPGCVSISSALNAENLYAIPYIAHPNYCMSEDLSGEYDIEIIDRHCHKSVRYTYGPMRKSHMIGPKHMGITMNAHIYPGYAICMYFST